ncbi:MAG: 2-oxopent-4-enoate hydratase [Candidatus Thiodiazotropha weberae]|uniref:2-oxopent-4-enoate hydratase n=1 Tax=Candidatus Thiodiazotropha endoloripes TaxID=1818881 RepID=A0A1E2UV26_9GAMM|nr:2-oxopent-4-enoate hydratase [Candidatus Thiodiazotropha endoloripes]MCG7900024.1 2-oxopent-4-enoate hydratase [Candidatus Thiodiazotropha weberae]MCG7903522.1 2-oxopent-4-enoate hydratase [Candidatus Thiodiazotropha weberae]ODB84842.1 2-oxopent-4-enoate hydratase [Candidatus Thiodiazotropha endoloripes]ODB91844.1 2-oxopent-4-enoate hydratase [Candidatus Thiodiazotropha endoloripes]ODB94262.1 2-oxopent-4-enoate hydratase [Candidatus Thiodiazotropha endoloripes]
MNEQRINELGDELYQALSQRQMIDPLTEREPQITIEDAYHVSLRMVNRRVENGESIIGKKIGVTSQAVQNMLNVHQPDFGYLTDRMVFGNGDEMPISEQLIQPRAEGEIAFMLKRDLIGPGVSNADVLRATEAVIPCFEIVDSRIRDWKIKIQDTVADNASCGLFVLGDKAVDPRKVDLATAGMVVEKNGELLSTGAGAAALGSPVNCVAWLANTLGSFGIPLKAGEVILSGSLVPLEPVVAGDFMRVEIGGIGSASVRFT